MARGVPGGNSAMSAMTVYVEKASRPCLSLFVDLEADRSVNSARSIWHDGKRGRRCRYEKKGNWENAHLVRGPQNGVLRQCVPKQEFGNERKRE
jgi:hypothetical protein